MLTDRRVSTLQPLKPVALEPVNVSRRRIALQRLKNTRSLRVSCSRASATLRYAVEVCESRPCSDTSSSRIPSTSCPVAPSHTSTVCIERELHEFIDLRDRVYNIVRWAHRDQHCDLCGSMIDLLVFGPNPDSLFLGLFGSRRASTILTNFVAGILKLATACPSTESLCACTGSSLVPEVVHAFLFDPAPLTSGADQFATRRHSS